MKGLIIVLLLVNISFSLYANEGKGYVIYKNGALYCKFKNQWRPKITVTAVDYWVNISGRWLQYVTMQHLSSVSNWDNISSNQIVYLRLSNKAQKLYMEGYRLYNKCRVHFFYNKRYEY